MCQFLTGISLVAAGPARLPFVSMYSGLFFSITSVAKWLPSLWWLALLVSVVYSQTIFFSKSLVEHILESDSNDEQSFSDVEPSNSHSSRSLLTSDTKYQLNKSTRSAFVYFGHWQFIAAVFPFSLCMCGLNDSLTHSVHFDWLIPQRAFCFNRLLLLIISGAAGESGLEEADPFIYFISLLGICCCPWQHCRKMLPLLTSPKKTHRVEDCGGTSLLLWYISTSSAKTNPEVVFSSSWSRNWIKGLQETWA